MWVAVDTMSGDAGPEPAVHGVAQAVREFGARVILVGKPEVLEPLVLRFGVDSNHVKIEAASEVIGMEEAPSRAVRRMGSASVVVAAELVKAKAAVGFFSPGNTGATMAAALLILGRVKGVERPAIATPLPREDGETTVLLDSGANVDCKPGWLVQFAVMGEVYSREMFGRVNPKIGLLSNGEEDKKGNTTAVVAHQKLRKLPYNFVGNIEGRDLYGGERCVDVVVCDGFLGNIILKATEGLARTFFTILRNSISGSQLASAGAFLLKPALQSIRRRMDAAEYGGAPLLGVNGTCIIGHGSSNATAFKNAVMVVHRSAQKDLTQKIEENIKRFG